MGLAPPLRTKLRTLQGLAIEQRWRRAASRSFETHQLRFAPLHQVEQKRRPTRPLLDRGNLARPHFASF
jgi:hypothetical protein